MITISLCMIVKNEEKVLENCLNSVKDLVDEIIIADTGSTDRTKDIAERFTENIYDFQWIDDFSAARNFAYDKATKEYILWLDADDIILPQDAVKFKQLKETLSDDVDIAMMLYNTGFDEHGNVTFSYYRERLSKNLPAFRWMEPVHEYLKIGGNIINTDICITHSKKQHTPGTRNIQIYENLLSKGIKLSPRGTYYYARELKDNGRHKDAAVFFEQFLEDGLGWVEDNIAACGELARCYQALNDNQNAFKSMLLSFRYDTPRAELCCQLGYYFKNLSAYRQAIFWFELAINLEKPHDSWGFHQEDCWGYIPSLECAVCYDYLKDYEKAEYYNDMADSFKPDSPSVLYNKIYFKNRKQTETSLSEEGRKENVSTNISRD